MDLSASHTPCPLAHISRRDIFSLAYRLFFLRLLKLERMYGMCRVILVMMWGLHTAYAFPSVPAPPFALVRAPFSGGLPQQPNALSPSHRRLQLRNSWRRPALQARLDVQTWEFEPLTTQGEEQGKAAADFGGFDWKKNWYPVAFDEYTDKSAPFAFTLLGERLVVWWDHKNAAWCAMKDVCPHRLAPLSEGRVNEKGAVECPYHGWAFDGSTGACTSIPHSTTPERVHSDKRACGTALYTALEQGIIWVWAEPKKPWSALFGSEASEPPPSRALIPTCPAFDSEGVVSDDVSVDVPYDFTLLLENVMDISHVPYTHHGTQGKRNFARPMSYKLTAPLLSSGFALQSSSGKKWTDILKVKEEAGSSKTVSSESEHEASGAEASHPQEASHLQQPATPLLPAKPAKPGMAPQETVFRAPCYQHTEINVGGVTVWVVTYAVPTVPGQCRLLARFPVRGLPKVASRLRLLKPVFLRHMLRNQVLEDDNILIHLQERELALRLGASAALHVESKKEEKEERTGGAWASEYYLATAADTPVVLWRRWLDRSPPLPWPPGTRSAAYFEVPAGKSALLDRQKAHLAHCLPCQKAAASLKQARMLLALAGAAALVVGQALMEALVPAASLNLWANRCICWSIALACAAGWAVIGEVELRLVKGPYPPTRNRNGK